MKRAFALALALALSTPLDAAAEEPPPTVAPEREAELNKLFKEAQEHYRQKRYTEALPLFQTVADELGSPNAMLYVARCLRAMERNVEAYRAMDKTRKVAEARIATEPRFKETLDAATKELAALEARVGRITISVPEAPPGLVVEVAGEPIADLSQVIVVPPGRLVVVARADNQPDVRQELDVAAGAKEHVVIRFGQLPAPSPSPTPTPQPIPPPIVTSSGSVRVAGIVLLGVSAAAWVTVAVTGVLANLKWSEAEEECGEGPCVTEDEQDIVDDGRQYELIANVGIGVGAATAIAGTLMVIFGGPSDSVDATAGPQGGFISWRAHF